MILHGWRIQGPSSLRDAVCIADPSTSHPVAGRGRLHQHPACGGLSSGDETILAIGIAAKAVGRFVAWIRQACERLRIGCGVALSAGKDGALDFHAGVDVLPQRDEQLSSQSDDCGLAQPSAVAGDTRLEPAGQGRFRLVLKP